jgi:hypothetical protein
MLLMPEGETVLWLLFSDKKYHVGPAAFLDSKVPFKKGGSRNLTK